MLEERRKILEMLADGRISVDDADRLLDKIGRGTAMREMGKAPARYLRLVIDSDHGDKFNLRVPLALIRTGVRLAAMMPEGTGSKIEAAGIDLSDLSGLAGDELVAALQELSLEAEDACGETVRIFCE